MMRASIILVVLSIAMGAHAQTTRPATQPTTKPAGLPIAPLTRATPISFEKEVLPILSTNCLACHNKTKAKANLILESPADILKGGDTGPAIIPKKSDESLLLLAAAHRADPIMPPKDNKVAAADLNPQQLALLKLWIDQGGTGSIAAAAEVKWQAVKETFAPIYAVALTGDGQWAAFGRGNQLLVYHVPTKQIAATLSDSAIQGSTTKPIAHRDLVRSLSFSPDGSFLASGAYQEVKLWKRPINVQKFATTQSAVIAVAASSPDNKFIATAGAKGAIRISDAATGQKLKELSGHTGAITSLQFSPDSGKLLSTSADKTVRLFDIVAAKQIAQATIPDVTAAKFITNGTQIAAAAARRLVILKLPEGAATELVIAKELPSQESPIKSMDATLAGPSHIVVGCEDGSIRLWNVDTAAAVAQMKHDAPVVAVAIRADGKRLASAGATHVRLWDEKGKQVAELKGIASLKESQAKADRAVTFAASEVAYHKTAVAAADKDQKAQAERLKKATDADTAAKKALDDKQKAVTAAKEAKTKAETEKQPADKLAAATKAVTDAEAAAKAAEKPASLAATELELSTRISAKANESLAAAQAAMGVAEFQHKSAEASAVAAKKSYTDSAIAIRAICFSNDGQTLATAADDKIIQTFSSDTGAYFESFSGHAAPITSLAFTTSTIISASEESLIAFTLRPEWTLDKKLPLANQPSLTDCINALDFSADGTLIAAGGGVPTRGSEIRIWSVADGSLKHRFDDAHSDAIFSLDFTPDGKRLASAAGDRFARIFDLEKSALIKSLEGHTHHVLAVAWKRDGRILATAGADNVVKIWDSISGDRRKQIEGWGKEVTSVAFIGDTDQIVTTSGDGRVRILKEAGQDVKVWSASPDFVTAGAVSLDGSIIVTGGQDGILRISNGTTGAAIAAYPQ
jgi:WD40 repeat protein